MLDKLLSQIILEPFLHAKWLNTLSYLENCGARKIAACEHPYLVKEEMLKHAAEEFRHAYHLKKQIQKLGFNLEDYRLQYLLGSRCSYHYLNLLDLVVCRILKTDNLSKHWAYFLVTYAIEERARTLYPLYQAVLKKNNLKISVSSIIKEEEGHLQEMIHSLEALPPSARIKRKVLACEQKLYKQWLNSLMIELNQSPFSKQLSVNSLFF